MKAFPAAICAVLLMLLAKDASADRFTVAAPVTQALLFPSQAQLTRQVSLTLPAGTHDLALAAIPELDLDQLQVRTRGVTFLGAQTRVTSEAEDVSQRRQALQQEIRELEQRLANAKRADELDRKQIDQLLSLLGQAPQGPALYSELPVQQWSAAWQQVRDNVDQRQAAINQRAKQRPDWQATLKALRADLQQLGRAQQRRKQLVIQVQAEAATEARLELQYFTGKARWRNQLRVDLDSQEETVTLEGVALMENHTGEDWQQVAVTLGLIPAGYRALPDPSPWIVGLAQRQPKPERLSRVMAEPAGIAADAREETAVAPAPMPATPQAHGLDMRVPLPGKWDLASDGRVGRVSYQQASTAVSLSRESYLWQQPALLLVGEWRNDTGLPWLAGPVTLLRDGQRLARYRRSAPIERGEAIRMSFGDDPLIQIEQSAIPAKEGETGLFDKEKTRTEYREVVLTSAYEEPVQVTLYDRLPVPSDERISVTAKGAEADIVDAEGVEGLRAWRRRLAPGKALTLKQGYQIRYPDDRELTGIPGA